MHNYLRFFKKQLTLSRKRECLYGILSPLGGEGFERHWCCPECSLAGFY